MSYPIYCPNCERDEIIETQDGYLICKQCGHHFIPQANPSSDKALIELRKQSALLRKIIALLKRQFQKPSR